MEWSVTPAIGGVRIEENEAIRGRAFFYPGRLQGRYTIILRDKQHHCKPASLNISVDTDYTQYVSVLAGNGVGAGVTAEFPGLTIPAYAGVESLRAVYAQTEVASETAYQFGLKTLDPRIYISGGYLVRTSMLRQNPNSGFGLALERLPDVDRRFSMQWGIWYFPSMNGAARYTLFRCRVGETATMLPDARIFILLMAQLEHQIALGSSAQESRFSSYVGVGLRL